jgi:hypothetical protein
MDRHISDIPVEGLQDFAHTIRKVFFGKTVCLARLSDVDNDACDVGEFLHHSIPFFFVLLHFLFIIQWLAHATYKESSRKRTPRI